jgi:4-hydroxybenzoate polyprenyltransferase
MNPEPKWTRPLGWLLIFLGALAGAVAALTDGPISRLLDGFLLVLVCLCLVVGTANWIHQRRTRS